MIKLAHFKGALLALAVLFSVSALAAPPPWAPGKDKEIEYSSQPFDRQAALQERREYHAWLKSERVSRGKGQRIEAQVSVDEMSEIDNAPRSTPLRVGLAKSLDVDVNFKRLRMNQLRRGALDRGHGSIAATQDGGYVYTAELGSPQATGLRVHFTGFSLPQNAGLFLYNDSGQVFGPYTGRGPHGDGEFWSHTLMGENLTLQLRQLGPASDKTLRSARFKVTGVSHLRPRFLRGEGHCNNNESCVESASCSGTHSSVNNARNAVAHMQWVSGPYIYICSGGLLADTDESTDRPLFLSANHCIRRGKDARNLENFFQLTAPCGTTSCDDIFDHQANHPQGLRTLGASILSTNRTSDYTLFELNEPAPSGSAFLGWTSTPVANSNGTALYRISHPDGSPQAYSEHDVDTGAGTCSSWPRGNWIYSRDVYGATEGGSSGSPVVNSSGQVVGQLSGGCGTNVNDVCDVVNNATVDGALAAYFSQVEQYLDPGASCVPEEEVCDGEDNDCDGQVDEGCGGGGQPGDACVANSDCASNKCKGKPGSKTCR